jgi:hypothetical protein
MTENELALADLTDAVMALTCAVLALVIALVVLSWSLDDMGVRVRMFGVLVRRLAPLPAEDRSDDVPDPSPAAQKAAKATESENHA